MFKIAKIASFAASRPWDSPEDVPEKHQWALDCDWEHAPYEKMMHFTQIAEHMDNRDTCLLGGAHMFAIGDLDTTLSLDKCEWSFICLAMSYEEGDEDADLRDKAEECVKTATKYIEEDISLPDVGMACAEAHMTL